MRVEQIDTLVVGGGQAGIAMSEHLSANGVPHLVLERNRVAERWRTERWDSLVTNGPAWHDRFPGLTFSDVDRETKAITLPRRPLGSWSTESFMPNSGHLRVRSSLRGRKIRLRLKLDNAPPEEFTLAPGGKKVVAGVDVKYETNAAPVSPASDKTHSLVASGSTTLRLARRFRKLARTRLRIA